MARLSEGRAILVQGQARGSAALTGLHKYVELVKGLQEILASSLERKIIQRFVMTIKIWKTSTPMSQ